jgi:hypothetical protein
MSQRVVDAILFPLLSMIIIAAFAGGLGVLFIVIEHSALGLIGVIVLGVAIVVGVPSVAALIQRQIER